MISNFVKQMSQIYEVEPSAARIKSASEKSFLFKYFNEKDIFIILAIIHVILFFITLSATIYLSCKFHTMYSQFKNFSGSLYYILSVLELSMPNYRQLKEKIEKDIDAFKTAHPRKTFFTKIPKSKKSNESTQQQTEGIEMTNLGRNATASVQDSGENRQTGARRKTSLRSNSTFLEPVRDDLINFELENMKRNLKKMEESVNIDNDFNRVTYRRDYENVAAPIYQPVATLPILPPRRVVVPTRASSRYSSTNFSEPYSSSRDLIRSPLPPFLDRNIPDSDFF